MKEDTKNSEHFELYFYKQLNLIRKISRLSRSANSKTRFGRIFPLLYSIHTAGISTILLVKYDKVTEGYVIARTYLERIVNACYLMVCDNEEFEDYISFSMQKIQRSLKTRREVFNAIGKEITVPDFTKIPVVAKGLKKYTSKRGKEITRWTALSVERRIAFVKSINPEFQDALFIGITKYIYEDASEASHGTIYGAIFHTGVIYGVRDMKTVTAHINILSKNLFFLLGFLVDGLITIVSTEISVDNLKAESEKNSKEVSKYFC